MIKSIEKDIPNQFEALFAKQSENELMIKNTSQQTAIQLD